MSLRARLAGTPALAFGMSGALTSPLVTAREAETLARDAYAAGLRVFDTAPAYGAGAGERRLGRALKGCDDAFVMTKTGLASGGFMRRVRDFSPDGVEASVRASLERLGRARLDLLWLHGPASLEFTPALLERLAKLKADGLVAHFGVAGRTDTLRHAHQHDIFDAVMLPVHGALDGPGRARIAAAREAGRMVFGIEVLSAAQRTGRTRGGLWRLAQRAVGRGLNQATTSQAPEDALRAALDTLGADVVVATTTSAKHLKANIETCAPYSVPPAP